MKMKILNFLYQHLLIFNFLYQHLLKFSFPYQHLLHTPHNSQPNLIYATAARAAAPVMSSRSAASALMSSDAACGGAAVDVRTTLPPVLSAMLTKEEAEGRAAKATAEAAPYRCEGGPVCRE